MNGNPEYTYEKDTRIVSGQNKTITIENLTPVYSEDQKQQAKSNVEGKLYEVFKKYQ